METQQSSEIHVALALIARLISERMFHYLLQSKHMFATVVPCQ